MNRIFWLLFFAFWPIVAIVLTLQSPGWQWSFPGDGRAGSPLGAQIDHLFYMILVIVGVVFVGTQLGLMYVLWTASRKGEDRRAWYSHGNHRLEVIWTVIPAVVLLFIAFYQMNVWAQFRMESAFPEAAKTNVIAEVTARQFEWRMRYPVPGQPLGRQTQLGEMHTVNELHVPAGTPVTVLLRTQDVQHSLFLPQIRIKQDAVPGKVIPVWFEATEPGTYDLVCAELCGWGHYKMGAKVIAHPAEEYASFLQQLYEEQLSDGFQGAEREE